MSADWETWRRLRMDERSDIEKRLRRKCRGLSADEISDAVQKLKAIQAQTDKLAIQLSVWTDGEDWVIATSEDDADRICAELYGSGDLECKWRKLPNDKVVIVDFEDGPGKLELTCEQWIRRNGRGHLCCADY